jgi:hypothetical protein
MNKQIEALIRQRVIDYHSKYPQYGKGYWDEYRLCVITGDIDHLDIKIGTVTIARYYPATFEGDAHCDVMKILPDFQSACLTHRINHVRFI